MNNLMRISDSNKTIFENFFWFACQNSGELTDSRFATICDEFGVSEEDTMNLMFDNDKYEFDRYPSGWNVSEKNQD